ncbi:hypothetical protein NE237_010816 [Protea cynaroides]|uniref:Uncharacterized protein n=1 Tax=Protea cynaroides TaxID=273540 RepID=A0A9Q0L0G7_9MAGN|nr:hypothetical protein NE237_010816 [Protea cynaroides]
MGATSQPPVGVVPPFGVIPPYRPAPRNGPQLEPPQRGKPRWPQAEGEAREPRARQEESQTSSTAQRARIPVRDRLGSHPNVELRVEDSENDTPPREVDEPPNDGARAPMHTKMAARIEDQLMRLQQKIEIMEKNGYNAKTDGLPYNKAPDRLICWIFKIGDLTTKSEYREIVKSRSSFEILLQECISKLPLQLKFIILMDISARHSSHKKVSIMDKQ